MIVRSSATEIAPARDVSNADWDAYDELLHRARQRGQLHSPFLNAAMIRAYSAHRDSVYLARGVHDGKRWAFPFEGSDGEAERISAIGMGLLEWQAVVSETPETFGIARAASLSGWKSVEFDHVSPLHLSADHPRLTIETASTPWVDLSKGFTAYCQRRRELGGSLLKQTQRKTRKLQREIGAIAFEFDANVDAAMDCLLRWKSKQHERTHVPDAFQQPWLVSLLRAVAETKSAGFRGRISLLKAGGRPIAVHLGVETSTHAHLWYPAYDYDLRHYSPGNVLFLHLVEALAESGVRRFDFGPGGQPYKDRLKSDDDVIARGHWDANAWHATARRQWKSMRGRLRSLRDWVGAPRSQRASAD